jgi:hypothetical protein
MLETRIHAGPRQSGNREFGFVMAGAFLFFTLVSAWKHRGWPTLYLPVASFAFLFFTLTAPSLLTPLNFAWSLLGRLLHRVVSPMILGLLYFVVLTPFGVVFRTFKKDPLRLTLDPSAGSYWIKREQQPGKSMANQF